MSNIKSLTLKEYIKNQEIMASIIDKAREYSPDNNESKDAFLNGALWMLEKACEYMRSQYPVHYQEWYELAEERVKQFKKAMEE